MKTGAAKEEVRKWDTSHNQAEKTMTHTFNGSVRCVADWEKKTLSIVYKEEVVDVFPLGESYTVKNHEALMLAIAEIAQKRYIVDFRRKKLLKNIRNSMPKITNR